MIPRIIHQIWIGSEIPDTYAAFAQGWRRAYPSWQHVLWSDRYQPVPFELIRYPLTNEELFDEPSKYAPGSERQFQSDVLRYELLYNLGGIYVDADFECVKSIEPLLTDEVHAFAAWEREGVWVNNAIMGSELHGPFMERVIAGLPASVIRNRGHRPNKLSGPQYITPLYFAHPTELTVFPKAWFYPYTYNELERAGESFPNAYAIHHWNNARVRKNRPITPSTR